MENITGYLIRADQQPYRGHTESILYMDAEGVERVAYTGQARVVQFLGRTGEIGNADGVLGRDCACPYKQHWLAESYLQGFMAGAEYRRENNITITA